MLHKATPQDVPALQAFLEGHAASSMFLRGNLEAHGTDDREHHHGTTFFLRKQSGAITGVIACSNAGYLMCQAPEGDSPFWRAACEVLTGRAIHGITGDPAQTGNWIKALGARSADFAINEVTPLFQLDLTDVKPAPTQLTLRAPRPDDVPMLTQWYEGFHRDTGLGLPASRTNEDVAQGFVASPDGRILMAGDTAVAMTRLNARAVDMVQIGGVYVPPDQRAKGYGGAVVALHLAELAKQHVRQAILFAANDFAARAYQRIGFRRVGDYRVAMLKSPLTVGRAS